MNKNEYLNEEKYQKNIKKIKKISLTILLIGLIIGGSVIGIGVSKHLKVNEKYSESGKAEIQKKHDDEKKILEDKRAELEANRVTALATEKKKLEEEKARLESLGIKYNNVAEYEDGDEYTLLVITNSLDPSFSYCSFGQYKNHDLTKKYCSLVNNEDEDSKTIIFIDKVLDSSFNSCNSNEYKSNELTKKYCVARNELEDVNSENRKSFEIGDSIPFYMFGGFIIFGTCMFAGSIYMTTKRREIAAFSAQQMNPIAKEQIESMGSSLGKAMANAAKEINPEYKAFTCPNCGANIDGNSDTEVCAFCGTKLTKVGKID